MSATADEAQIEISCEKCGAKTKKSAAWAKDHEEFECGCGTMIRVDPSKYRKELARTESKHDGSLGLLEKLGK